MQVNASKWWPAIATVCLTLLPVTPLCAAPSATQALTLTPLQRDIDYDQPEGDEKKRCTLEAYQSDTASGWIVRDGAGRILRSFLDTNSDKKVDQWCYFRNGIEVYRDADSDFDGKADQYRWLGTAGIRWGLDPNEDGEIDSWKVISAEEVSAEVVAALRDRDEKRFRRLLLSTAELKNLGVGTTYRKTLADRLAQATSGFRKLAQAQSVVKKSSTWIHFGGSRPAMVPAGTDGSRKDLIVYDNVSAVIETDGQHGQVIVGTLVKSGEAWRLIDLPHNLGEATAENPAAGILFAALNRATPATVSSGTAAGISESVQQLMTDFEKADRSVAAARTAAERSRLNAQRADILEQLIEAVSSPKDKANWVKQYADTVSGAVQTGEYTDGLKRLDTLYKQLAGDPESKSMAAYVRFRYLSADYSRSLNAADADFVKVQEKWLKSLNQYVSQYPASEDAPDAMLQLALAEEFAGEPEKAKKWYTRITSEFAKSPLAKKAAGAKLRLDSVGKSVPLRGVSLQGSPVDLGDLRGKTVLVHYWSTWCEPCKSEFALLKKLHAKYSGQGFRLIGVSLDNDRDKVVGFLNNNRLPWPQLHEEGGLDSRYANELGVLTLPTMLLIDETGKVVRRDIHAAEVEAELRKLLR